MSSVADDAPAAEAAPRDEVREGMLATLTEVLGEAVLGSHIAGGDLWVRVSNERWLDAVTAVRDRLHCDYFCFLNGIDWLPNADLATRNEKAWDPESPPEEAAEGDPSGDADAPGGEASAEGASEIEVGYAGGTSRFQVFCRLYSTSRHWGITLKADLDEAAPSVASITSVYRGADWHERETWEMFGFDFAGHPRLRHLYLPGEFEGHPLRKDFPLLSREVKPWPGLVDVEPLPGEPDGGEEEASS